MSTKAVFGIQLSLVATVLTFAPLFAQETTAPNNDSRPAARDRDTDTKSSPNWGWLGIIGLAGLGGLAKRDRDRTNDRPATDRSAVR